MKKIFLFVLLFILAFTLSACDDINKKSSDSSNASSNGAVTTTTKSYVAPADAIMLDEGIFYYELYELEGDPGEGITPKQGAALVLSDVITPLGLNASLSDDQCIYISFDDMQVLDSAMNRECYIYSVALGTKSGGFKGNDYEVYYRASVDYHNKVAALYEDFKSSENDDEPSWWGIYVGNSFTIGISNYNGTSFRFTVIDHTTGESVYEGAAAIDPNDAFSAHYEDVGFYLYPGSESLDFQASETSDWIHVRGNYNVE